jgi:outer membrane protein
MTRILLLIALSFSTVFVAFSQTKTAHINYSKLVLLMPETKKADTTLSVLTKNYQAELTRMQTEYKTKLEKFQAEEKTMPAATKELRTKELTDAEASYNKFQEAAKKDISEKDKALFKLIFEKAENAVKEVAKEKGYSYVIDSSKGNYVYLDPKEDIFEAVKKKLGL